MWQRRMARRFCRWKTKLRQILSIKLRALGGGVLEAGTPDAAKRAPKSGAHVDLLAAELGLRVAEKAAVSFSQMRAYRPHDCRSSSLPATPQRV